MKLFSILLVLMYLYVGQLFAQSSVEIDTSSVRQVVIDEITVKSPKQQNNIRRLPASISIVTSRLIENSEVNSLKDLSSAIPNFFMPDYGSKLTSPVYIRGIGSRINSPSVGIYVDNVPYFEKAAFDFDFFDIERVEVLRGPQGTLYGRNTMGGIINVFTKSPLVERGSKIKLSAGNYGNYSAGFNHYGQIGEKVGFSVNLSGLHRDGFFTNLYLGDKVDKLNSGGARGRLVWKISERLNVENVSSYEHSDQGGYPYVQYIDSIKDNLRVNYDQYSSYVRDLFSDALVWNYSGDKIKLHATTSFQYLKDNQSIDQDFTPAKQYFVVQEQAQKMFSQEIVMKSNQQKKYEWLFGVYGFVQLFDNSVDFNNYPIKLNYIKQYDHRIQGAALFHQSTLNDFLIPNLSVIAGLRLDLENDRLNYIYDILTKGSWVNNTDTLYPSLNSSVVVPKLSLNYQLGNSALYVTVASGYKTGGFNSATADTSELKFGPENSINYELGWRAPLLNHLFYADAAVFYIDWKNQQIAQTSSTGRGLVLKNAGISESKGVEFSLKMAPVKGFEANINYGYTKATFIKYIFNSTTDYSGNFIPFVPEQTVSASGSKTFQFNHGLVESMRINLGYRGTGKHYWNEKNDTFQDYYGLLDGKISFTKGDFQLDLWGKNLLDTQYYSYSFEASGKRYLQLGRPSQLGVNLSLKF